MKVLRGVLVFGRIAATNVPADEAQAQMHPAVPHLHALFTNMLAGLANFNLVEVCAFFWHRPSTL